MKRDWTEAYFSLMGFVLGLLLGSFLSGCATSPEVKLEDCDTFISRRVEQHVAAGAAISQSGTIVTQEGIILYVQLVQVEQKKVILEALVDTELAERAALEEGLKKVGTCDRGGRTWVGFSGVVGVLKGLEADKGI